MTKEDNEMFTKTKTKIFVILMAFVMVFTLAPISLGTAYALEVYDTYMVIDLANDLGYDDYAYISANIVTALIREAEKSGAIYGKPAGDDKTWYDLDKDGTFDMVMRIEPYKDEIIAYFYKLDDNSIKGAVEFQLDEEAINYYKNLPEDNEEGLPYIESKLYIRFDDSAIANPNNPNPDYLEARDLVVDFEKGTKTFKGAEANAVEFILSTVAYRDEEIIGIYDENLSSKDTMIESYDLDMDGTLDLKGTYHVVRDEKGYYRGVDEAKLKWLKDSNLDVNFELTLSDWSFGYCSNLEKGDFGLEYFLKSLTLNRGKEKTFSVIHDWRFEYDKSGNITLNNYKGKDTEVTIPDSIYEHPVTVLNETFDNNKSIVKVTIPESVITINGAFAGCTSLETAVINGNGLKTLGEDAFDDCEKLKEITLPDSLTSIGDDAFYLCRNLSKIVIPANVASIGSYAFNLAGIDVEEFVVEFTYGSCLKTIGDAAFRNCVTLKKIRIPASIKSMGNYVFENSNQQLAYGLEEVIIEPGGQLKTIGEGFFKNCYNLGHVTIPGCVKKISKDAFSFVRGGIYIHFIGSVSEWDAINFEDGWINTEGYGLHIISSPRHVEKASLNYDGAVEYRCDRYVDDNYQLFMPIYRPAEFKLSKTSYIYNGKAKKPTVTVKDSVGNLISSDNYKLTYSNNTKAGKAKVTLTFDSDFYRGTKEMTFTIKKAANTIKVTPKTAKVKYSALKKAKKTLKRSAVLKVTGAKGTVTYTKASGNGKITISKKTGKVTVKKGLKKGTYMVKVKVKAAGTSNYKAKTKTVTFKIKVV